MFDVFHSLGISKTGLIDIGNLDVPYLPLI